MSSKITPTIEGGLLTAVAVILGIASTYLPVIGLFLEFFCAVPIVVLTVRQGIGKGSLALIASFLILAMFIGPLLSMRIALSFGICGLVLGFCIKKNFSTVKSFSATFLTSFIAQIFAILLLTFVMGINVMETEISSVQEMFDELFKVYEDAGVSPQDLEKIREQVAPTLKLMSYLLPFLLALIGLLNAALCYLTSRWIFQKLKMKFLEPLPLFAEWRFPKVFLYLVAFSSIGCYWGSSREWDLLYTVSINVQFFSMCVAFVQGMSVLSAVAEKYNISTFLRRIFFIVSILNLLLIEIVSFVGLFDMVFDYRKGLNHNDED